MDKIYDKHYEVWKPENATESGVFGNFELMLLRWPRFSG
jgi:hypothetical protein